MPSNLSLRISATAFAAVTVLTVAPAATAAPPDAVAATAASPAAAGVMLKMPATVAETLGASRQSLVDAVAADALGRSTAGRGLTKSVALGKLAAEGARSSSMSGRPLTAGREVSPTSRRPPPLRRILKDGCT
ncbi:hypothetical protein [Kribbella sp. CA-294648]|uniref:hypothetical protein n=1 Tax=Kribbella sp. CA-294648 TaxID=3239948 RepID=UPI003D8F55B2